MSIKQALPVFSNYKKILTQGRNKENKNGGEDKNSFKDHRYDEHHRDAGLALALLPLGLDSVNDEKNYR